MQDLLNSNNNKYCRIKKITKKTETKTNYNLSISEVDMT